MDVSFSQLHKYETCGAAYQMHYRQGLRTETTAANLLFGKALHQALTDAIAAHAVGQCADPVPIFEREWDGQLKNTIVAFSATQDADSLRATGTALCRQFPEFWQSAGLTALIGPDGQPLVEKKLTLKMAPGINLRGYLDVAALSADGDTVIVDLKSSLALAPEPVLLIGEQLTDYQMLVEANQTRLGIESVAKVGFIELLKRKVSTSGRSKGPEIVGPSLTTARTEALVRERREKIAYLVNQIRKGAFFRRPGMAYNSPCTMCDFANLCLHGSMEGLVEPNPAQPKIV